MLNILLDFYQDVEDAACVDYYYNGQLVCWTDIHNEHIKCVQVNATGGGAENLKEVNSSAILFHCILALMKQRRESYYIHEK